MNGYRWIVGGLPGTGPKSHRSVQATQSFPHLNSVLQPSSQPSSLQASSQSSAIPKSRCSKIPSVPSSSSATQSLCSTLMKVALIAVQLSFHIHQVTHRRSHLSPTVQYYQVCDKHNEIDTLLC